MTMADQQKTTRTPPAWWVGLARSDGGHSALLQGPSVRPWSGLPMSVSGRRGPTVGSEATRTPAADVAGEVSRGVEQEDERELGECRTRNVLRSWRRAAGWQYAGRHRA